MSAKDILMLVMGVAAGLLVIWLISRGRKANRKREATRRDTAQRAEPRDPLQRDYPGGDPRTIKLGDLLEWPGCDDTYAVRGTVLVVAGSYSWQEHFVDPVRGAKRYVSVDSSDGDLSIAVWDAVKNFDISPGSRQVVWSGVTYTREETGTAHYRTVGTTDLPVRGTVEYQDYKAGAGRLLSFERFDGGEWELSLGQAIDDGDLTVYPAS